MSGVWTDKRKMPAYVGNGATSFAFDFPFDAATDIRVQLGEESGGTFSYVDLLHGTDYQVTANPVEAGGSVLYPAVGSAHAVLSADQRLVIYRDTPKTQERAFSNDNGVDLDEIGAAVDKLTMGLQEVGEAVARSLLLPLASTVTNLTVPAPQAGRALVWGPVGTDLQNGPSADEISGAAASAAAASSARELAEAARDAAQAAQTQAESVLGQIVGRLYQSTATNGQTTIDISEQDWTLPSSMHNLLLIIGSVPQDPATLTRTSDTVLTLGGPLSGGEKIVLRSVSFVPSASSDAVAAAGQAAASATSAASSAASAAASASALNGTNRPLVNVRKSADQSVAQNTWERVTFDVESIDTDAAWTNSRFTPGVAGKYACSAAVTISTSVLWVALYVNGVVAVASQGYGTASVSAVLDLAATDYVEVYAFTGETGKSVAGSIAGIPLTQIHCHRLGGA